MADNKPEVAVIMGSASDWETMKHACEMLDQFEVPYMKQVISAHRTPELMGEFLSKPSGTSGRQEPQTTTATETVSLS